MPATSARWAGRRSVSLRAPGLSAGALAAVIEACKPGAKLVDLCDKGDSLLNE